MTLIQINDADRRATAHLSGAEAPRRRALGAAGAIREACAPMQNALAAVADLALIGGRSDPEAARLLADITCRRAVLEEALAAAGELLERRGARVTS
jgi:hypothetical protein